MVEWVLVVEIGGFLVDTDVCLARFHHRAFVFVVFHTLDLI